MAKLFSNPFKRKPVTETRAADYQAPTKIFIEKDGPNQDYLLQGGTMLERFYSILNGFYSNSNFIELFHCLPEVFAPIHEIASRVADAVWQFRKDWNDEVDYKDADFNRLFSTPNPLQAFKAFVYNAVCFEILTGKQFWYLNKPSVIAGWSYKDVASWTNLIAHEVIIDCKKADPYSATTIQDFVNLYKAPLYGGMRIFPVENVIPILNLSLKKGYDLNCTEPLIKGAEKAIKNLIPVYEARGIIYIKRGAMGFIVSRKSDESGAISLTPKERKELDKDFTDSYGITGSKETISKTGMPVDFVRTAMSIQELEPFSETLADAAAIYAVLRVPPHLIPSKDKSTFNNANSDMKAFYENVIIPWAKRYAEAWTNGFRLKDFRRYIFPDFSHIGVLQEDKKGKSETDRNNGGVYLQRWQNGVISLNEWIVAVDGIKGTGPIYEKKIFELTPEEIAAAKEVITLFKNQPQTQTDGTKQNENTPPKNSGA